ncbi:hypothetical protein [Rhodococcus sp. KRD197]|uniref:hypothetical protein n=1 Tax=unclassified Rhodococcus (in: high G+C Gram-positive bacteria) TaxID=192944 RepID=UPI001F49F55D|nr:hypothetical protein [Rhodococcus sp. KRD197]
MRDRGLRAHQRTEKRSTANVQWVGQFVGHRRWGRNHLGITVPDYPNLFITCGPGTVLGHGGSYITIAECQVRYIVDLIGTMAREGLGAVEMQAGSGAGLRPPT